MLETTNGSYDPFMDTYHGNRSHNDMLKWSLSKLRKSLQKSKTKKRKPPKVVATNGRVITSKGNI